MWPWEHVMLGYVLYSVLGHLWGRGPPSGRGALVVAFAALLPDLIDKPLAWQFAVLPGGRSLGHSLLFALPAAAVVGLLARRAAATDVGVAFGVGYLSHLPADSVYPLLMAGEAVDLGYLIWPFASASGSRSVLFVDHLLDLAVGFAAFVTGPDGWRFLVLEGILFGLALGLWIADGRPGPGALMRSLGRIVPRSPSSR